ISAFARAGLSALIHSQRKGARVGRSAPGGLRNNVRLENGARVLSLIRPADAQVSHVRDRVSTSLLDRRGVGPADGPPKGGVAWVGRSAGSTFARRPIACRRALDRRPALGAQGLLGR